MKPVREDRLLRLNILEQESVALRAELEHRKEIEKALSLIHI